MSEGHSPNTRVQHRLPFTPDDLLVNRTGRMSNRQIRRLRFGLPFGWHSLLMPLLMFFFAQSASAHVAARPSTATAVTVFSCAAVVSACYSAYLVTLLWRDAHQGVVRTVAGKVEYRYSARRRPAQLIVHSTRKESLELRYMPVFDKVIDVTRPQRVYYAPRSKVLLSFEPLQGES